MSSLCNPIDAIFWKNSCKIDLSWKKESVLIFTFCILNFFLCNTIKKIISLVLYENQFFKKHTFPDFIIHLFMPFLCKPIDAVFRNNSCRNDLSLKKKRFFFSFHFCFLFFFLCTTLETIISIV